MTKFDVFFERTFTDRGFITVEADDPEAARKAAFKEYCDAEDDDCITWTKTRGGTSDITGVKPAPKED